MRDGASSEALAGAPPSYDPARERLEIELLLEGRDGAQPDPADVLPEPPPDGGVGVRPEVVAVLPEDPLQEQLDLEALARRVV